ncbi:hypothetical protein FRC06_009007, partial [Ceratobasidium sp. 370]
MDNLPISMSEMMRKYIPLYKLPYLLGSIVVVKVAQWSYWTIRKPFSPLRRLPGPKSESFIWGNLKQVLSSPNLTIYEEWSEIYGSTFAYQGLFSLKDILLNMAKSHSEGEAVVDVLPWIGHATLDIIGVAGRDLLTLLIKSNMANENEGQRMTDDEVLAQISTFLLAGHETTGTSTAWALYALTQHPEVQRRLRKELLESGLGDEPGLADLDKLPYLDNVVHESLRLYPAVPASPRQAAQEVHIPTSRAFKDRTGTERTSVLIQKGDLIVLPILAMNRNKGIWGEDSMEFRPERWDDLPQAAKMMPGVWGHLMT